MPTNSVKTRQTSQTNQLDQAPQLSKAIKAEAFDKALLEMHRLGWCVEIVCGPRKEEMWFSYSSNSSRAPATV